MPAPEVAMRRFLVLPLSAMIVCGVLVVFAMTTAPAQMTPAPQPPAGLEASLLDDLVAANRVLAQKGVLDALGHVSVRDPRDPNRYWMSRSLAPALVTPSDIMEFDLDSNPIDREGRSALCRAVYSWRNLQSSARCQRHRPQPFADRYSILGHQSAAAAGPAQRFFFSVRCSGFRYSHHRCGF